MKTKLFSVLILALSVISGCSIPRYLPKTNAIDINLYGSYIKIIPKEGANVKGELLGADTTLLIVFTDSSRHKIVRIVPVSKVKRFSLRYAQPKSYWWTIGVFPAICASHGWWAILSIPLNLAITAGVSASATGAYKYSSKNISYEQLRMFARFPGGIPSNIILSKKK